MDTNQKQLFRQQTENGSNQPFAEKQIDVPQEEPGILIPDEPTIPEAPDENPDPNSPEPGMNEPGGLPKYN